ncbi:MAG: MFS transporter, partial [Bacteroidia bacterium]|nr:MFS transporter [Bacteroidia bacterium]
MKKVDSIFYYIIGLFFFWGFVAASNDVLIPIFKDHLQMEQWQSQLISFVFYVAYTVGSILYVLISYYLKQDLLAYIGYTKGLGVGLIISSIGTLFFIPAANQSSFYALITGLFIIGLGFSLQQTAANPLVILSGDESYGSQRLSLAGGINNIGTTIGPLIVSYAVFGTNQNQKNLSDLKLPYLILGFLFIVIALLFFRYKKSLHENTNISANYFNTIKKIISKKQVWMAMLAIFVYVGVEVSCAANLAEFAKYKANIHT